MIGWEISIVKDKYNKYHIELCNGVQYRYLDYVVTSTRDKDHPTYQFRLVKSRFKAPVFSEWENAKQIVGIFDLWRTTETQRYEIKK